MLVRCRIKDVCGDTVSSKAVKVTLLQELKITGQPASVSTKSGKNVKFSVKASGSGLKYQWYYLKSGQRDWAVWKNHNTASTSAVSNASWNGMKVMCVVTDASGKSVKSTAAKITIVK